MKLLVVGGTGFVGQRLVALARAGGHEVVVTSRGVRRIEGVEVLVWDTRSPLQLPAVDCVVHLAGEGVFARRWSAGQRAEIHRSRVQSTLELVSAMRAAPAPPRSFVCASAVGFYGATGDEELDETAPPGEGFLADVCKDWEAAAAEAEPLGVRVVRVRVGVVLGTGGGALQMMKLPFSLGLGGPLGGGRQWVSWIHLEDAAHLLLFAAEHPDVEGVLNATAPNPVRQREFASALGRVMRRPAFLPAPGFAVRLALGGVAEVVLGGQRVVPRRTLESGFEFRFAEVEPALRDLLGGTIDH